MAKATGTVVLNGNKMPAAWHVSPSTGQRNLWIFFGGQSAEWNYSQDPAVITSYVRN